VATALLVAGATRWHGKLTFQNHAPCLTLTLRVCNWIIIQCCYMD